MKFSLLELHQIPLTTDYIFPPTGCKLAYHTLNLSNGLFGIFCGSTTNLLLAHNILLLASFALSGFFAYLLVQELTDSYVGALVGGIIFAFSPPKWTAAFHGQMNISSTQWLPLFLFFLVKSLKNPRWYWSLGMSLSLVATLYTSYQQCVFLVLLAAIIVPFTVYKEWSRLSGQLRPAARNAVLFLLLTLFLASPLIVQMVAHYQDAIVSVPPAATKNMYIQFDRLVHSQTFRHGWTGCLHWGPARNLLISLGHLLPKRGPMYGYVVSFILVTGWVLLPFRKESRGSILYWSLSAIPATWLMMGLNPEVFGFSIPSIVPLFLKLPGFSAIRGLYRYSIPLTLLIAILAGFVLTGSPWMKHGRGKRPAGNAAPRFRQACRFLCIPLIICFPYLEYLKAPLLVASLPAPPAVYLENGKLGGGALDDRSAILELPFWCSGGDFWVGSGRYETLYFQSLHQRRMVGGHHSRIGRDAVSHSVFNNCLRYLSNTSLRHLQAPSPVHARNTFRKFGVGHVNVARASYRPEDEAVLVSYLEEVLDAQLIYQDTRFLTYRIPPP